jgi:large subunit ribosomal protein L25
MKSITIKGSERESVGKVATKALRNAGLVPCVLYGIRQFISQQKLALFKNLVYTQTLTQLRSILGKSFNAILQDIQVHPVSDKILHIDFFQITTKKSLWKFQ